MWTKFVNWVNKVFLNPWAPAWVASAFVSVISAFQIDSYAADKYGLNPMWIIFAIVFFAAAVFFFIKMSKTSGGNTGYKQ
jgi:hypothetical protein